MQSKEKQQKIIMAAAWLAPIAYSALAITYYIEAQPLRLHITIGLTILMLGGVLIWPLSWLIVKEELRIRCGAQFFTIVFVSCIILFLSQQAYQGGFQDRIHDYRGIEFEEMHITVYPDDYNGTIYGLDVYFSESGTYIIKADNETISFHGEFIITGRTSWDLNVFSDTQESNLLNGTMELSITNAETQQSEQHTIEFIPDPDEKLPPIISGAWLLMTFGGAWVVRFCCKVGVRHE